MSQIIISLRTGKDRKRRGFILLTHAVMLLFTIAMVGLAVDAGTMYVIKGRLSSAVDAAALAAGRSVNLADTVAAAATAEHRATNLCADITPPYSWTSRMAGICRIGPRLRT